MGSLLRVWQVKTYYTDASESFLVHESFKFWKDHSPIPKYKSLYSRRTLPRMKKKNCLAKTTTKLVSLIFFSFTSPVPTCWCSWLLRCLKRRHFLYKTTTLFKLNYDILFIKRRHSSWFQEVLIWFLRHEKNIHLVTLLRNAIIPSSSRRGTTSHFFCNTGWTLSCSDF